MQPILILTKNLLVEKQIQEQLQQLNYEVWCSFQLLKQVKKDPQVIDQFQVIIFSETVTNKEITDILSQLTSKKAILFRKFSVAPTLEEQEQLREIGVTEWLTEDISIDVLRECLAEKLDQLQQEEELNVHSLRETTLLTNQIFENFLNTLTKKEKQVFLYLQEAHADIVSREALCEYLWHEPLSHSRMSQLSVLVKNIKQKLKDVGFSDDLLRTIWGKGYCLMPEFFTLIWTQEE
ncbi:winged helix-turn-helix domain-containing protein [Enterococcus pallens]|uniref:OmpR/PhoB-type domain-containing protein n=1 Tax=Enterococcus pallens ATCC BAA-351 TaxID=1158607 RepID=R2Q6C0_9ENTE|nr:winged helix-turn-helix domain-containing protein [Enterococcus pallens]EOH92042.1 hypothetical protein UAU_02941 [Enterococcus pallens ATCC BAA-351]EOU25069.1 hypothetical protein I588_01057 [Enterococcus pallens ATCC BAA-351]OJG72801.1 hypothetical protein RV10_GL004898 [Enterococcus pallens]